MRGSGEGDITVIYKSQCVWQCFEASKHLVNSKHFYYRLHWHIYASLVDISTAASFTSQMRIRLTLVTSTQRTHEFLQKLKTQKREKAWS